MSAKQMGMVWELALDTDGERLVLLGLADHADHEGYGARPGGRLLAWKTDRGVRSVRRILRDLEAKGLIRPTRYSNGGRGNATEYQLLLERGTRKPPFERAKGGHHVPERGTPVRGKADIAVSSQPSGTVREPSDEEQQNRKPDPEVLRDISRVVADLKGRVE